MTWKLPVGVAGVLPLAACAALIGAEAPLPCPETSPGELLPSPFCCSASLRLSLHRDAMLYEGDFTFWQRDEQPATLPLPLPRGRLAGQESATHAALSWPEEGEPGSGLPSAGQVRLPGAGLHRLQFELHVPVSLIKRSWEAAIPHPGAPVCQVSVHPSEGLLLQSPLPDSALRLGEGWMFPFLPTPKPAILRWSPSPAPSADGIALQRSHADFSVCPGDVRGRTELRISFDSPRRPARLQIALPPACILVSVESGDVSFWHVEGNALVLSLRAESARECNLVLHTSSPITAPGAAVSLPLPRCLLARRAEGTLSLRNEGPHHLSGCDLPPGFQAKLRAPNGPATPGPGAPALEYEFFSLEPGATVSLSLFQPHPRLRTSVATSVSIEELRTTVIREIRLQAEFGPIFATSFDLPREETISEIRLLQGAGEMQRTPTGQISLLWSQGLPSGEAIVLQAISHKPLLWHQETASFRHESPTFQDGPWSGSLHVRTAENLLLRPVRNPQLRAIPAAALPPGVCAAWHHDGYDVLIADVGIRPPTRSFASVSRVRPSLQGIHVTGELRIDPGGSPLETLELRLDHADPGTLRLQSPLASHLSFNPEAQTLRLTLQPPPSQPFSLPWKLALPPAEKERDGDRLRMSLPLPQLLLPALPCEDQRVTFARSPFAALHFEPAGFAPVPLASARREAGPANVPEESFIATAPHPSLRFTLEETGATGDTPWEMEDFSLVSQVEAWAPSRHRCAIVLSPAPGSRQLPLRLPPQSTLLSLRLQSRPLIPLESPHHARELLIPLPAGAEPLRLELDYVTEDSPWRETGEATLLPPVLPRHTLTRHCAWKLVLPRHFHYPEINASGLSWANPPAAPPITLQPVLHALQRASFQAWASASPASTKSVRTFQGDFSPSAISLRYVQGTRQWLLVLLWVLTGAAAFFVFARERPLYLGAFGVLLLTFLPLSGLVALPTLLDGLLAGWLAGAAVLLSVRLVQRLRTLLRGRAAPLLSLLLSCLGGFPPSASSAPASPPPFRDASHQVHIERDHLRVISTYTGPTSLPAQEPLTLWLSPIQLDSVTIDGVPLNSGQRSFSLPDRGPHALEARYRIDRSPASEPIAWEILPAIASRLILSGVPTSQTVSVNGELPLLPHPGGITAALGSARGIHLSFRDLPTATTPSRAQSRLACGLFPTSVRLALDLRFDHPGQSLDRYSVSMRRDFQLVQARAGVPLRIQSSSSGTGFTRVDLFPATPRPERMSFQLEWEAPLPEGERTTLVCPLPQPHATTCDTSLTLAAVAPLSATLRSLAQLPASPAFLPSSWGQTAQSLSSVRLPSSISTVSVDRILLSQAGTCEQEQLFVTGSGHAHAFCLARLTRPEPWFQASFPLHPALRATSVSGASLLDWDQTGHEIRIRRAPGSQATVSFLFSFSWDPTSGDIPYPLLQAPGLLPGEISASVASVPGWKVLNALPASADASPFLLSPPLQLRARLDAQALQERPPPRAVPAPSIFHSKTLLLMNPGPQQAELTFQVDLLPQDAFLESVAIQVPENIPAISWSGPFLREARAERLRESEVHTLSFTGPVTAPLTLTGKAILPLPASGLRLSPFSVSGATRQERFYAILPPGALPWKLDTEGLTEIPLRDLPPSRPWRSGTRAFAHTSGPASLSLSPLPSPEPPPSPFPAALDLHLASVLHRNGDSSHRARVWLYLPAEPVLPVDLPPSSVLTEVRLNGERAGTRALASTASGWRSFAVALPHSLSRRVPCLVEISYATLLQPSRPQDGAALRFQLEAPRLGNLTVTQTLWQVRSLDHHVLRLEKGNLYPLTQNDFFQDRLESFTGMARELQGVLERGGASLEESSLIRDRILALTSLAASGRPGQEPLPIQREARQIRQSVSRYLAEPAAGASASLVGPWLALDQAFQAHSEARGKLSAPPSPSPAFAPPESPAPVPRSLGLPLSEMVAISPLAVPWMATGTWPATAEPAFPDSPRQPASGFVSGPSEPPAPLSQPGVPSLAPFPPLHDLNGSAAAFFKKLKGDAQLDLIATPNSDPAILGAWIWFAIALLVLAGLERLCGRTRRASATR